MAVAEPCCRLNGRPRAWWVYSTINPLSKADEEECLAYAKLLNAESVGRQDSVGDKDEATNLKRTLTGARAERAFANFWGVPWPKHVNDFTSPDFYEPFVCEIRGTAGRYRHYMPLRKRDFDLIHRDRPYIHIRCEPDGRFHMMGYAYPSTKTDEPRLLPGQPSDWKPAVWVPYRGLHYLPYHLPGEPLDS